ncbi:MAG: hypothetical protein JRN15_12190 [Nitrososphaerota archaeon]|nr:hypothetical protein [Nitrososphaerota archaeon]
MSRHIYQYNINSEQRFFLGKEHHDLYDLIALNGNIVSHAPAGVAAFVANAGKPFYVDPQTHAFQHATIHLKKDISDKEKKEPPNYIFRPSIKKLAQERLGEPFSKVIDEDRPLRPKDFTTSDSELNESLLEKVCQNTVDFQLKTLSDSIDDEARELLGGSSAFKPEFILAPYFYLSPLSYENWLNLNLTFYNKTKQIVSDLPVFLALVISKEALEEGLSEIVAKIKKTKPDGILLWIDDHVEEELNKKEIWRYVDLLSALKNTTETIYNSHGGYLSILLGHEETGPLLDGVGHSINYGESRAVVPVGGGIPMARFYMFEMHSRLRWGDALGIATSNGFLNSVKDYLQNICSCIQCASLLKETKSAAVTFDLYGDSNELTFRRRSGAIVKLDYPTKEAKQFASRHYLYNKAREFDTVRSDDLTTLLNRLKQTYEKISPTAEEEIVANLFNWEQALVGRLKK